jgi:hypothetical protein
MALLDDVMDASGGLPRWNSLTRFTLHLSLSGLLLSRVGLAGHFKDVIAEGSTRTPSVRFTGITDGQRCGSFRPEIVTFESLEGEVLQTWRNPTLKMPSASASMAYQDELHLVFLCGVAIWTSLATPFSLTAPDLVVDELLPLPEADDQWRRLRVRTPPSAFAEASEQILYFDDMALQRRMDHDFLGARVADYSWAHQTFDGIVVPTLRRSQLIAPDGTMTSDANLLGIEIFDAKFD